MAKGKKARAKGRQTGPGVLLFIALLLLAGLAAFVLYFGYWNSGPAPVVPAYEETHPGPSGPRDDIAGIDRAIYGALYGSGTREEDVHFLSVQPRRENGRTWESAELQIDCPDAETAAKVSESLDRALGDPALNVRVHKGEGPGAAIVYEVYSRGLLTHRLVLAPLPQRASPVAKPRVAIIIDDMGYDKKIADSLMGLHLALTFSVLPYAPHAQSVSREAAARGFQVLLHLPMEPKDYPAVHPGEGALLLRMQAGEIAATLAQDLKQVPGARGVNNHMGSGFTEDDEKMSVLLSQLKKRRLFYIDSRTSSRAVGFELAARMGVPAAKRSIFLDNDVDPRAIRMQLERLMGMARHAGSAIGIAHPHRETVAALREGAERISREMDVVPVSELLR
jgi:uncharacterized protein